MSSTVFFFIFIPLLSLILLTVNVVFAPHNPYTEKNNAFECGFSSFLGQNRMQFSISFFIFALLFLLFDLEILLVYPYLVSAYINEIYGLLILIAFLGVLTVGFIFELGKKALTIDSRQTALPNYNITKKSLLTKSYSTISLLNSTLLKSFYKGSVIINESSRVKLANFHSSSLYREKESSFTGTHSNKSITSNWQWVNNPCFLLTPKLIKSSTIHNKKLFSTTRELNGLGLRAERKRLRMDKDEIKSVILGSHKEEYITEEASRILKRNENSVLIPNILRNSSILDKEKKELMLRQERCENYILSKAEAVQSINSQYNAKLRTLRFNSLPDNKLPNLRVKDYNAIGGRPFHKNLEHVRNNLNKPVKPKPVEWRADKFTEGHSDLCVYGSKHLRPLYSVDFSLPENQPFDIVDYPVDWMIKPKLHKAVIEPLKPVEIPIVPKPVRLEKDPAWWFKNNSVNLTKSEPVSTPVPFLKPVHSFESLVLPPLDSCQSYSALLLFSSFSEVSPCLRFLFVIWKIINCDSKVSHLFILIYNNKGKDIFNTIFKEVIKIMDTVVSKNNLILKDSNPHIYPQRLLFLINSKVYHSSRKAEMLWFNIYYYMQKQTIYTATLVNRLNFFQFFSIPIQK